MSGNYKFCLGDEAEKFAVEHLGETSEVRIKCIEEIRQYLIDNSSLNARNDDLSILAFLRGCKYNIEKTKIKLKNYYEMRAKIPEWFNNRDPLLPEISELLKLGVFIPIIQSTPGPLIVIIRTGVHNPWSHKQNDVFKVGKMILDLAVKQYESATIYGVYAVFDMKNVTLGHARQLPPSLIQKAVFAWQNYHCRPQNLEFINAPIYVNVVLNVFKSFMSRKMKSRVHVHFYGYENLHKVVSKDVLPEEYGGNNGKLQTFIDYWNKKVTENADWYKEDEKYKADLD